MLKKYEITLQSDYETTYHEIESETEEMAVREFLMEEGIYDSESQTATDGYNIAIVEEL